MDGKTLTILLLIALFFLFIKEGIKKVSDGYTRVVERMGRRHKILLPGINIIIPLVDSIKKPNITNKLETFVNNGQNRVSIGDPSNGNITMAETRMDPPVIHLYTKDNTEVSINSVAYFKVVDPFKALYEISSFADSFKSLVETALRQEVGTYDSDAIITARESLSESLRESLQEATTAWGIRVMRVEIEEITFKDRAVVDALSNARRSELERRAALVSAQQHADTLIIESEALRKKAINDAEGVKQKLIIEAEGYKQKKILEAEGDFETNRLEAEAEFLLASREQEGRAQGYLALSKAMENNSQSIIAIESVRAQIEISKHLGNSNNTMIIPTEVAGLIGAASAAISSIKSLTK